MKQILIAILAIAWQAGISQSLGFSEDTVIAYTCSNDPDMIGQVDMYNTTGDIIGVEWHIHHFDLPHNGIYALIMAGHQYVPFEDGHLFSFNEDTSQVLFYMWNDTLYAGDTSIMQIRVWDVDDSINTMVVLTAMKVCPVTTSANTVESFELELYPNPADDLLMLKTNQPIGDQVRIANCLGQVIQTSPLAANAMNVSISALAPGLYALTIMNKGRVTGTRLFFKR